ncbi:hypothetical protein [Ralstonia solanacearum]|nr:hypothetical protein [Ralstonia solanacearum]
MMVLAGCAIGAGQGVAAEPSALTVDQLRTPEQAIAAVWDAEQRGYGQVLAAYEDARKAAPDDVTLAASQCGFIQRFAWSEESTWTTRPQRISRHARPCSSNSTRPIPKPSCFCWDRNSARPP